MAFYKWLQTGELNWLTGQILTASDLNNSIDGVMCPIKSVIPWLKSFGAAITLPEGWVECDGSVINDADSPLDGETLPDLNGEERFLQGASTSGSSGGSTSKTTSAMNPSGSVAITDTSDEFNVAHNHTLSDIRPKFYTVVFIMRIK